MAYAKPLFSADRISDWLVEQARDAAQPLTPGDQEFLPTLASQIAQLGLASRFTKGDLQESAVLLKDRVDRRTIMIEVDMKPAYGGFTVAVQGAMREPGDFSRLLKHLSKLLSEQEAAGAAPISWSFTTFTR